MPGFARRSCAALVAAVLALGMQAASGSAAAPDFSAPGEAFNVLPPGQAGFPPIANSLDQVPLYDGLTPRKDNVTAADLPTFFKQNVFGLGNLGVQRTQTFPARPDLVVRRDTFGVPHIEAPTRDDVMFGIGWVHAEDRMLLMDTFRGPGRIAALDAPGLNAFQLAQTRQSFSPTAATEAFLAQQIDIVLQHPRGQRIVDDIDNYLAGINAFRATRFFPGGPWTRNDVIACAALIAAVFGRGGGDEARRAQFLSAL
jgi:hypothetical protein